MRKFTKRLWLKISPTGKRNNQPSPRDAKSRLQDKPKEKYTKRHTNETNKDKTQRKNIRNTKRKATSNI